jgi:hypothetical protein
VFAFEWYDPFCQLAQVTFHRGACGVWVFRFDGVHDGLVFCDRIGWAARIG